LLSQHATADEAAPDALPPIQVEVKGVDSLALPFLPAESRGTVESVKASVMRVQAQASTGLPEDYVIEFGDTFDWIQLVSGEWLKGEIKRMRDDNLEFDSDELGMQSIDFADVVQIHSPHANTYAFDQRVSEMGRAVITADKVIVETEEGTKTFDRSELQSIVSGGEHERDWWWMKLRFGLTLNRGNTNQLTYNIEFHTRREDDVTLLDLDYNATFGRTDGVQNVKRHLGEFKFLVFLSKRWFLSPAFGQLFNDAFQNIKFRATPAAGAGIHLVDAPKAKWDFQTGLGYQYLNYLDGATAPHGNPQNDMLVPIFTYADFDITGDIELTVSWRTNLIPTTIGNTNHTGKADLSVELTSVIDLDVAFLFLRTNDPAPPPDPTAPPVQKNDYQLVLGIAVELG